VSGPRTALHRAVSAGKVENIRVLIDAGAHLEAPDPHNGTPLCLAASNGLPEVVAVLVETGALLVPPFVKGTALFPLLCAAEGGYGAVAEYLLDRIDVESIIRGQGADGANANASASADAGRLTLLGVSAMLGYTGLAQRILNTGYDVNRRPPRANILLPRWTLLRIGADRGHIELVRLFLRHGAKSCTEKPRNRNRDHGAEDAGFCAFDKGQPLARAVEQGHAAIVRILLEAGAPPNIPINRAGTTILQVAAEKKQQPQPEAETDIAQLLLDYGATPTPAVARAALSAGNIALVRQLAARGIALVEAGSDHQDNHNTSTTSTTLLKAAASGGPAALDLLRDEYGMRPDPTVPGHAAPLEIIIRRGDVGTVGYCLSTAEHGFRAVLARNALHLLAVAIDALSGEKLVQMLEVLVAALSSWSSSQSQSHTNKQEDMEYQLASTHALHAAIPRFRLEAIYLLLKKGADVDWRGAQGMNAWDVACSIENREMLEMLLEHALTKLGGNLAIFRRYTLPIEERAREAGQRAAVKEISYFYYRRKYSLECWAGGAPQTSELC
jgi:ankyrin repeat protein